MKIAVHDNYVLCPVNIHHIITDLNDSQYNYGAKTINDFVAIEICFDKD